MNSTKVIQTLLQVDNYGTSLPQSPEISGTGVFDTQTGKQKHESPGERGEGKAESEKERREDEGLF